MQNKTNNLLPTTIDAQSEQSIDESFDRLFEIAPRSKEEQAIIDWNNQNFNFGGQFAVPANTAKIESKLLKKTSTENQKRPRRPLYKGEGVLKQQKIKPESTLVQLVTQPIVKKIAPSNLPCQIKFTNFINPGKKQLIQQHSNSNCQAKQGESDDQHFRLINKK